MPAPGWYPPSIRSITFPWDSAVARIVARMKLWNLSGIGLPDWSTTEAALIDAPGRGNAGHSQARSTLRPK